jgi:alkyl sulfatase BDS1-like metallo-beta-lactamase superfamily hydrolase
LEARRLGISLTGKLCGFPPPSAPKEILTILQDANAALRAKLNWADKNDFDAAKRGFIAKIPDPVVIKSADNKTTVWSLEIYNFITANNTLDDAPDSVNPSLWRMAKLNMQHGLFEVVPKIYQIRGMDLAVMSVIKGDTGYIVIDPLTAVETASYAWKNLVVPNLGDYPIKTIIYTHSHTDHYAGVRGLVTDEQVASGAVKILAPAHFVEAAVGENIIAGNVMSRRATYMYGSLLQRSPTGQVDGGLGKGLSAGTTTLVLPTDYINKTGEKLNIDGIEMEFIFAPESEAPSEFMFYLPQFKAFMAAEDATHTLHNLYTLRGAKVRDGLVWSKYLQEALDMFPDMEVVFASHHWPTWGNANVTSYLKTQRDTYRFLHDQAMRLANQGVKPREIAELVTVPESLDKTWSSRSYYGTIYHDLVAQYNLRLGFFNANPAELHHLPPAESGKRFVRYAGGADNVMKMAKADYDAGDYRWCAEALDKIVYSDPSNQAARNMLADVYDQLGYQAESGPWRNFYFTGADELRRGLIPVAAPSSASPDTIKAQPLDMFLDYTGVRLNSDKAAGKNISMLLTMTDTKEKYEVGVENGALHYTELDGPLTNRRRDGMQLRRRAIERPDVALTTTREAFNDVMMGTKTVKQLVADGNATMTGANTAKFDEFVSWLDKFDFVRIKFLCANKTSGLIL